MASPPVSPFICDMHPEVRAALHKVCRTAHTLGELRVDDDSPGAVGVGIHWLYATRDFERVVNARYGLSTKPSLVAEALDLICSIRKKTCELPLMEEALLRALEHEPREDASDAHHASDCFHDDNEY